MNRSHCLGLMLGVWCAQAADLSKDLEHIGQRIGGRAGVSAVLIETGEHAAFHGDQTFFMASVVKFPVALRVLQLVDEGKLRLDQKVAVHKSDLSPGVTVLGGNFKPGAEFTIRDLLHYMITASDNTACDVLMGLSGGPQGGMARLQALGIQGIRIDRMEKQVAADYDRSHARFLSDIRDTSTPDAMAALLAKFQAGEALKPASTKVLQEMLERTTTFPNRLKGLLPPGTIVAHKTGTWSAAATNDVGIITLPDGSKHIAIAVFTNRSKKDRTIAEMGRAVYDHWAGAKKESVGRGQ
jgi:beta-lactamase class A